MALKSKPILFSGPMVRAIFEGRKFVTRRIIKPQPEFESGYEAPHEHQVGVMWKSDEAHLIDDFVKMSPYGKRGDLLWVRENCAYGNQLEACNDLVLYAADYDREVSWRWKPSIHMHRWASRITLVIKDIRVERLQDISEEDAKFEGVFTDDQRPEEHDYKNNSILCTRCAGTGLHNDVGPNLGVIFDVDCTKCDTNKKKFKNLWGAINGFESWDTNPWLWVVDFMPYQCNIDEYMKKAA